MTREEAIKAAEKSGWELDVPEAIDMLVALGLLKLDGPKSESAEKRAKDALSDLLFAPGKCRDVGAWAILDRLHAAGLRIVDAREVS